MGFPSSSQQASATAGDPSAPTPANHVILAESISSVVGFCGFAAILLGEPSVRNSSAEAYDDEHLASKGINGCRLQCRHRRPLLLG